MERGEHASDIAVVGASAAGLLTAIHLARAGRRVTVFDRAAVLDPTPRTLIVTNEMRSYLEGLGESSIVNEIHEFHLFSARNAIVVPLSRPDLIVERSEIIRDLAKRAMEEGAEIALSHRFSGFGFSGGRAELLLEGPDKVKKRSRPDAIVGADGTLSAVSRLGGWGGQRADPLLQSIVRLPSGWPPERAAVWFRPEDTPYFYWLIPSSATHGAFGVIGKHSNGLRARLDQMIEEIGASPGEYQGARIAVPRGLRKIERNIHGVPVFLVGDAAGHVKVSTVGGLVTGFKGAIGVAEKILGHPRPPLLRSLRTELFAHSLVRQALDRFSSADYDRLLDLVNDGVKRSLLTTTRDEAAMLVLRSVLAQPRLVGLTLRALLP